MDAKDCLPQIATTDSVTIVNGVFAAAPAIARSVVVAAEVAAVADQSGIHLTAAGAQENYRLQQNLEQLQRQRQIDQLQREQEQNQLQQQLDQLPEQELQPTVASAELIPKNRLADKTTVAEKIFVMNNAP